MNCNPQNPHKYDVRFLKDLKSQSGGCIYAETGPVGGILPNLEFSWPMTSNSSRVGVPG